MSDLVTIEPTTIPAVFSSGGTDPIVEKIRAEVTGQVFDVSKARDRKEIASLAHKVARSKTYLDGLGKDLVADMKSKAKAVDVERKKMRDQLDVLKDEVRKPLTDWEEAEQHRVDSIKERISKIKFLCDQPYDSSAEFHSAIASIEEIDIDDSFEEFAPEAAIAKEAALKSLNAGLIITQDRERKAEEAAKAEAERLAKEQADREARIAREAAERATKEAEEKAAEEARKAQAEIEAAKQAEIEARVAAELAEKEKAQAAENERKRIEAERQAEIEEEERRARNTRHKAKINGEAKEAIMALGVDEKMAKKIVVAIAKNTIPNISISY